LNKTTRALAEWAESVTIESMPASVIDRVGYLLLDLLGVSIYGLTGKFRRLARSISAETREQLIAATKNLRKTKSHPYQLLKKELSS
jgi:2-methylcitrate dehydratase PrpD